MVRSSVSASPGVHVGGKVWGNRKGVDGFFCPHGSGKVYIGKVLPHLPRATPHAPRRPGVCVNPTTKWHFFHPPSSPGRSGPRLSPPTAWDRRKRTRGRIFGKVFAAHPPHGKTKSTYLRTPSRWVSRNSYTTYKRPRVREENAFLGKSLTFIFFPLPNRHVIPSLIS